MAITFSEILAWKAEYEASQYLRKLTEKLLLSRSVDLKANLWSTDKDYKVIPFVNDGARLQVCRLLFHVMLEQSSRKSGFDIEFDERRFRSEASADFIPPHLKSPIIGDRGQLAKFGKREHIFQAYKYGKLRIAPAQIYSDPSLTGGQQDDELNHWTRTPNEQIVFQVLGLDNLPITVEPGEFFRGKTIPNYYVWCCSMAYESRLHADFGNAVLIIRNYKEFDRRLTSAMELHDSDLLQQHGPIKYYDQYTTPHAQVILPFMKQLKFLYQNEFRYIWQSTSKLSSSPIFVELGSLEDIAEFCEVA